MFVTYIVCVNREFQVDRAVSRRREMKDTIVNMFLDTRARLGEEPETDANITFTRFSWQLVETCMQDESVRSYFMLLDLDLASTKRIFNLLLRDGEEEVDLAE